MVFELTWWVAGVAKFFQVPIELKHILIAFEALLKQILTRFLRFLDMVISTRWSAHSAFLNRHRELDLVLLTLLKIISLPTQKMVRKRPNTKDFEEDTFPSKKASF